MLVFTGVPGVTICKALRACSWIKRYIRTSFIIYFLLAYRVRSDHIYIESYIENLLLIKQVNCVRQKIISG